jgi:hypothetical protein
MAPSILNKSRRDVEYLQYECFITPKHVEMVKILGVQQGIFSARVELCLDCKLNIFIGMRL